MAVDNFEFDENGRKFSKQVENIEGKGEIACYEQFLVFPQSFLKACTADTLKPGLVWKRVNPFPNANISDWSKLKEFASDNYKFDRNGRKLSKRVENTVRKGEISPSRRVFS